MFTQGNVHGKVQLASTYSPAKKYKVASWFATPKFDGVRAVFIPQQGFFTRNDKVINGFDYMAEASRVSAHGAGCRSWTANS